MSLNGKLTGFFNLFFLFYMLKYTINVSEVGHGRLKNVKAQVSGYRSFILFVISGPIDGSPSNSDVELRPPPPSCQESSQLASP